MSLTIKNKIIQNSWSLAAQVFQWGFSFAGFILLIKLLDKESLGVWIIYMGIVTLMETFKNGLIQNAFLYYSKQKEIDSLRLSTAGLAVMLGIGAAVWLILSMVSPLIEIVLNAQQLSLLIYSSIIYLSISAFTKTYDINSISQLDFKLLCLSKFLYGSSFFVSIIILSYTPGIQLIYLPFVQAASALINLVVLHAYKPLKLVQPGRIEIKTLMSYGKYSAGTNMISILVNKSDIFILSAFLGPAAVAIYNVASRLINIMEIPLTSLSLYYFPIITKYYQNNNTSKAKSHMLQANITSIAFIIPMVLGVIALGKWVIYLVAGQEYISSYPVLVLLSLFIAVKSIGRFNGITLDAIGQPRYNFYILIFSLIVNTFLNIALVSKYGIYGVAIATIMTWCIGTLMSSFKLSDLKFASLKDIKTEINLFINKLTHIIKNQRYGIKFWNRPV